MRMSWPWPVLGLALGACGANTGGTVDAGTGGIDAAASDAAPCEAPDMLVLLDRTMSMHKRPDGSKPPDTPAGHMESKWYIAVTALEALTAELGNNVRFGLTLFPRDPGGDVCITLSDRINGMTATNPSCEAGETVVGPGPGTATAIAGALDPETSLLCQSTPIGAGLGTAATTLDAIQSSGRDQYVLFIGDGQDNCEPPLVIENTQALAADGVKTFVVAFDGSGGIDSRLLNDMACAGRTATGFPAPCTADTNGDYLATDRDGPALFLIAEDAASLAAQLEVAAGQVCCGCIE